MRDIQEIEQLANTIALDEEAYNETVHCESEIPETISYQGFAAVWGMDLAFQSMSVIASSLNGASSESPVISSSAA
jgi:hypothetical protein